MNMALFQILLAAYRLAAAILKYLKQQQENMTPEQKAEYEKACKENFDRAGGGSIGGTGK